MLCTVQLMLIPFKILYRSGAVERDKGGGVGGVSQISCL